ncbi:MAG: hypothetical protein ACRD21_23835, partial [Vicinamibacteria bacterium]
MTDKLGGDLTMARALSRSLAVVLALSSFHVEAQTKDLTIEAIFGGDLSAPGASQIRWAPDGHLSFFLSSASGEGRDLMVFDTETGERRVIVPSETLRTMAPSPTEASVSEREYTRRTR